MVDGRPGGRLCGQAGRERGQLRRHPGVRRGRARIVHDRGGVQVARQGPRVAGDARDRRPRRRVLAPRDRHVAADREEVAAVGWHHARADPGLTDVVVVGAGLVLAVVAQHHDPALGLGTRPGDGVVATREHVDGRVAEGDRAVVQECGVRRGAVAGHAVPETRRQRCGLSRGRPDSGRHHQGAAQRQHGGPDEEGKRPRVHGESWCPS